MANFRPQESINPRCVHRLVPAETRNRETEANEEQRLMFDV